MLTALLIWSRGRVESEHWLATADAARAAGDDAAELHALEQALRWDMLANGAAAQAGRRLGGAQRPLLASRLRTIAAERLAPLGPR